VIKVTIFEYFQNTKVKMNSILITGCNRGLGLGIVKALINSAKKPKHIFATCRNIEQATVSFSISS